VRHHWLAAAAFLLSWVLASAGGLLFAHAEHKSAGLGIYWAITTVTTVGYGDITPTSSEGHWIAAGTMVLAIPVWSLAFGLVVSWLTSIHVGRAAEDVKAHVSGVADGRS